MALSTVSRVLPGFKLGSKEPQWSEKANSTTGDDGVTIKGDEYQLFLLKALSNAKNDVETIVHELLENDWTLTSELPETELPESLINETAYHLLKQQLSQDNDPRFNLATFVSTYIEPEAEKLIVENLAKNFVDPRAYLRTADLERRCLGMLANVYHVPSRNSERIVGTSTLGSSEAIMLAILAMKAGWVEQQQATGKDSCAKPNIIMSSVVQVCWANAARYFDVEIQYVKCSEDRFVLDPAATVDLVNGQTIGICCILGTTYTGEYEDVKAVNDLLIEKGLNVPIHVDAASGGFVAPFVTPDLELDFRLDKVVSINVSGHKYGLVYPGVGWALWRSADYLPKDLIFKLSYLGTMQASFTLNFSRGSSHVIAQYSCPPWKGRLCQGFKIGYEQVEAGISGCGEQM